MGQVLTTLAKDCQGHPIRGGTNTGDEWIKGKLKLSPSRGKVKD
jgi:hypothetical protein